MKKRKAWIVVLLCAAMVAVFLTGCGSKKGNGNDEDLAAITPGVTKAEDEKGTSADETEETSTRITIAALKGPTAIGMVQVMDNAIKAETENNYHFSIVGSADEITADIIKGEIPIAAVPCNLASVLYNRTEGGIQIAAINTLSVLYIVENGDTIHSVEDLKGKTIYSTGKGTTPEYTLNYLLRQAGLDPERDVTVEFKSEATEVAALLSESENAIAMLPQPYVTVAMNRNENLRIALDVAKEWENLSDDGSSVVTGVVVVNKAFAQENKEAVDAFLAEYEASTKYVVENVEEAAKLVGRLKIIDEEVAVKAIPYCNIVFVEGDDMKTKVNGYLKALYDQESASVGGKLPEDDFYYFR